MFICFICGDVRNILIQIYGLTNFISVLILEKEIFLFIPTFIQFRKRPGDNTIILLPLSIIKSPYKTRLGVIHVVI